MFGRFFYGAVVGASAMYLLDPENGRQRRQRLTSWWRANEGTFQKAGDVAVRKAQDLKPAAEQATRSASDAVQSAAAKVRPDAGDRPAENVTLPRRGQTMASPRTKP